MPRHWLDAMEEYEGTGCDPDDVIAIKQVLQRQAELIEASAMGPIMVGDMSGHPGGSYGPYIYARRRDGWYWWGYFSSEWPLEVDPAIIATLDARLADEESHGR